MIENCEERLTRYSTVPSATKSFKISLIVTFLIIASAGLCCRVHRILLRFPGTQKYWYFTPNLVNKNCKPVRNDSMRV